MITTSESDNPHSTLSQSYLEAIQLGLKGVMYICDEGKERSEACYQAARDRNEAGSCRLQDGIVGVFNESVKNAALKKVEDSKRDIQNGESLDFITAQKQLSPTEITESMKEVILKKGLRGYKLRIFVGGSNPPYFLNCLKELNIPYEPVQVPQMMKEIASLGQDVRDYF